MDKVLPRTPITSIPIKRIAARAMAQALKELAQFRRDYLTVALAYLLPFMAMLMYGYATRLEAKNIPVIVYNYDVGKISRDYVASIFATNQFDPVKGYGFVSHKRQNPIEPIDSGNARASLIIPPEFARKVKSDQTANMQLLVDATDVNNARIIKNGFYALTQSFMRENHLPHKQGAITARTRLWFNPGRKESLHIVPGAIALVTWIFPALLSAFALVREKEQGTILQLYASSITPQELILGKAIAYFLIGMVEALLVIFEGILIFGVPFVGEIVPFSICTMLYVFSGVVFGLWAGSRTSNQMAAVQVCAMVGFLGSMLLSGFIYPLRNIAYPISLLSNLVAARYYIEASRDAFVRGGSWLAHWNIPLVLFGLGIFFFFIACKGMSKMELKA